MAHRNPRRLLLLWISLALAGTGAPRAAVADGILPISSDAPTLRFIVMIDASPRMSRCRKAAANIISDLIASGFSGQIQPGDQLGLWAFTPELRSSLRIETWDPAKRDEIARRLLAHFRQARFSLSQSATGGAWQELQKLTRDSPQLLLCLVTDGNELISGTPFDAPINRTFVEERGALRKGRLAFMTMLLLENRRWIRWRVHAGAPPISIFDMRPPAAVSGAEVSPGGAAAQPSKRAPSSAPAPLSNPAQAPAHSAAAVRPEPAQGAARRLARSPGTPTAIAPNAPEALAQIKPRPKPSAPPPATLTHAPPRSRSGASNDIQTPPQPPAAKGRAAELAGANGLVPSLRPRPAHGLLTNGRLASIQRTAKSAPRSPPLGAASAARSEPSAGGSLARSLWLAGLAAAALALIGMIRQNRKTPAPSLISRSYDQPSQTPVKRRGSLHSALARAKKNQSKPGSLD